jgi:predicted dithiol-disulfide oxidoreductase (DUF899 family)
MSNCWRGCRQCLQLIEALNQEARELEQRQSALERLNRSLVDNLTVADDHGCQTDWKSKYWGEVERSCRLEKELMEIQIGAEIDKREVDKKRENYNQLNDYIISTKLQGLENLHQLKYRKPTRKTIMGNLGPPIGNNEFVVRIIR